MIYAHPLTRFPPDSRSSDNSNDNDADADANDDPEVAAWLEAGIFRAFLEALLARNLSVRYIDFFSTERSQYSDSLA